MRNCSKGFSLIEVLVAKSIIFLLLVTFIPIYTTISYERAVLEDRIAITSILHDHLQQKIWIGGSLEPINQTINKQMVQYSFTKKHSFIKVCANWQNKQGREEVNCLYGLENK